MIWFKEQTIDPCEKFFGSCRDSSSARTPEDSKEVLVRKNTRHFQKTPEGRVSSKLITEDGWTTLYDCFISLLGQRQHCQSKMCIPNERFPVKNGRLCYSKCFSTVHQTWTKQYIYYHLNIGYLMRKSCGLHNRLANNLLYSIAVWQIREGPSNWHSYVPDSGFTVLLPMIPQNHDGAYVKCFKGVHC